MNGKKLILQTLGLFFSFCIIVLIIGSFVGCANNHIEAKTKSGTPLGHDRFYIIEGNYPSSTQFIYVDTETGVEYLWINGKGLTVLVDHHGKPLIAEGYRDY